MQTRRRFKGSFRHKLILLFTLFTGIISASFAFVLINGEIKNYDTRTTEKVQLLADMMARDITLSLYSENIPVLSQMAKDMLSTPRVARVLVTSSSGRNLVEVVAPSLTSETPLVTYAAIVKSTSVSPSVDDALSGTNPFPTDSLGTALVSIDASDKETVIWKASMKIVAIAFTFWVAVVAVCFPVLSQVTRSFDMLTEGLDSMQEGDYSAKIRINTDDEAGRAARAVNRLSATLIEREIENRNLQDELVNSMRLEVQEERKEMMAQLIQTNRMTSLGLLISSFAHNINTPNGAIKLTAEQILSSWTDTVPILQQVAREEGDFVLGGMPFSEAKDTVGRYIESVVSNAERVERVVQDLRAYNVGDRNEFHKGVSLNKIVEDSLTVVRAQGRQGGILIETLYCADLPDIVANQCQLEQVVVNLLLNAVQSMDGMDGSVMVSTEYLAEDGEVKLIVKDQGSGIKQEDRSRIFEAFFSTKLAKGGSGLGLYISNFIVSEHKGRLTLEPGKEAGTVATVCLPVA